MKYNPVSFCGHSWQISVVSNQYFSIKNDTLKKANPLAEDCNTILFCKKISKLLRFKQDVLNFFVSGDFIKLKRIRRQLSSII